DVSEGPELTCVAEDDDVRRPGRVTPGRPGGLKPGAQVLELPQCLPCCILGEVGPEPEVRRSQLAPAGQRWRRCRRRGVGTGDRDAAEKDAAAEKAPPHTGFRAYWKPDRLGIVTELGQEKHWGGQASNDPARTQHPRHPAGGEGVVALSEPRAVMAGV